VNVLNKSILKVLQFF